MVDRQMRCVAVSRRWRDKYRAIGDDLSPGDRFPNLPERWYRNAAASLAGELDRWELETCLPPENGTVEWVKWTVQAWKTDSGIIAGLIVQVDTITEWKLFENALQLTQLAMDRAGDAVLWITLEGRLCYANDTACHLLGYSRPELLRLTIHDIDPDLPPAMWSSHCEEIRHRGSLTFESCHRHKLGTIVPVEVNVNYLEVDPIAPEDAGPVSRLREAHRQSRSSDSPRLPLLCWFARNISDRKAASSAITESRDQLEAVLNAVPGLVSWIGSDRRYLGVNQHLANAYGVPAHQFIGREVGFLQTSPEFNQFVYAFFDKADWTDSREIIADVKGEPRTYLIVAQKYLRGAAAVFVGLDITERRNMEIALRESEEHLDRRRAELETALVQLRRTQTQLVQTEKMSSLGQLVAGIAHEINNPVNFIFGNLTHARNYIEDLVGVMELYAEYYPEPISEIEEELEEMGYEFMKKDLPKMLESMKVGAERIRDVVRSLRSFTRVDEGRMKPVDIHDGLESTILIVQNRLQAKGGRSSIELVKDYADLPRVDCYPGQLNQVFMNLLTHAIDRLETAMTGENRLENPTLRVRTQLLEGDRAMISIADNGPSLSPEDCRRVFEPLLEAPTTGQGTSLGLSIAHHLIVEKHGGQIACISDPPEGVEFQIHLPIVDN